MKKIFIFIIALTLSQLAFASSIQNASADDIFNEFSSAQNAEYVNINPFITWLGKQFIGDDADAAIVKKTKSVRVLDLDDCSTEEKAKFSKRINALNTKGYEEMMRVNDKGERVKILAKIKDEIIHQMLIVCSGNDDCVLVEVNGKFTMDDITGVVNSQTGRKNGR